MRLRLDRHHEAFRQSAAAWLETELKGPFAHLRGIRNHTEAIADRRAWEARLGAAGWSAVGWPAEHGGRGASITEQVIFAEEYARAKAPGRIGHIGVELAGPTILVFGGETQKQYFLPRILSGEHIWCQGYSEPNAGSDLANVATRARLENGRWIIDGQKVWTSMAHFADWCFALARTEPGSRGPKGLSFLLVPMRQPGVEVRPIRQMTGESEFNEVFFTGAETAADNVLGAPGEGWKVAMALLSFERGVSTLAQQMDFRNELDDLIAIARGNGKACDPLIRQRLADAHIGLTIMRYNALAMLSDLGGAGSPEALTYKLYWARWHRALGELAMDVIGPKAELGAPGYHFSPLTTMFLMSRSETIYGGADEIQKNIIAERGLGLPKEARGSV